MVFPAGRWSSGVVGVANVSTGGAVLALAGL
jgi:hypothetical protein